MSVIYDSLKTNAADAAFFSGGVAFAARVSMSRWWRAWDVCETRYATGAWKKLPGAR